MDATKKVQFNAGYLISAVIIGTAMFGWMFGFDFVNRTPIESVSLTLAKIGAFGGMAMFAWSLILSGRYTIFDKLFSGLDKMYIAHRFFGSFGLVLLIIHPVALTLALIPSQGTNALNIWTNTGSTALLFGYISLYGMIGLIVWSISAKVKHETFITVHKILGVLFFAGVAHAFMAGSVLSNGGFMYWYMLALSTIAGITFLHYSIFADIFHPHYTYKVVSVKKLHGGLLDVRLKPKQRIVNFKPGQFVYISFNTDGLRALHPFSIASSNRSSELQFIIKQVGDYTTQLERLKKNTKATLKGPYGGFTFDKTKQDKQLWIAGGIGITPFLSKARSLPHSKRFPQIELFYATKTKAEAEFAIQELNHIKNNRQSFNFTHVAEDEIGIVSLDNLKDHYKRLEEYAIYICGPPPMLNAYQKQAEKLGLSDQLFYEEFSY